MINNSAKKLKKLGDKQLFEDIKKYIKSSHIFYETRVPELKVLASRLHEEYSLNEFYKIFNKFWNSGISKESSLAIHTLQLYNEEFDMKTWKFILEKLKEIKSWDKIDSIAINIVGEILAKNPVIEKEILKNVNGKNPWLKRMAILSTIPKIRKKDVNLAVKIIESHLYDKGEDFQKAVGITLKEIGNQKPELLRRIISKNPNMPIKTFLYATENSRELRAIRENPAKLGRLFFFKK